MVDNHLSIDILHLASLGLPLLTQWGAEKRRRYQPFLPPDERAIFALTRHSSSLSLTLTVILPHGPRSHKRGLSGQQMEWIWRCVVNSGQVDLSFQKGMRSTRDTNRIIWPSLWIKGEVRNPLAVAVSPTFKYAEVITRCSSSQFELDNEGTTIGTTLRAIRSKRLPDECIARRVQVPSCE